MEFRESKELRKPRAFRLVSLVLLTSSLLILSLPAGRSAAGQESRLALGAVGGLPQMIGGEIRYLGVRGFSFGLGFGSLPINGIMNSAVTLDPQQVDLVAGKVHMLTPEAKYSMFSTTLSARYYPWEGGLFAQLGFASWVFKTQFSGTLQNVTDDTDPVEAISGSASINQTMASLSVGYQIGSGSGFFADFGLGGSFHFRPGRSISIGGLATNAGLVGASEEEALEAEVDDVEAQFNEAVDEFAAKVNFSPVLYFGVGWAF